MDVLTKIADEIYRPSCGFSRRNVGKWVERVANAADEAGYTICDLKPLAAKFKNCRPDIDRIVECVENGQLRGRNMTRSVAQALNWERTEFDTLDELLEELREQVEHHSNDALMEEAFEVLKKVESLLDAIPTRLQDHEDETFATIGRMVNGKRGLYHVVRDFATKLAMRNADSVSTTHTLLHAGELYREVTILLHTEQLVAWCTADGQEYSAPAHQVLLDPDEDGLAAAILSRIAGVEIAPEHMAELRAQMA